MLLHMARRAGILLSATASGLAGAAQAPLRFHMTDLTAVLGGRPADVAAIADNGTMGGNFHDPAGGPNPIWRLTRAGTLSEITGDFGIPHLNMLTGLNNHGDAVGNSIFIPVDVSWLARSGQPARYLPMPTRFIGSRPSGINASGTVAGTADVLDCSYDEDCVGPPKAFVHDHTGTRILETGSQLSMANGIDDHGRVVGSTGGAWNDLRPFLYDAGRITVLPVGRGQAVDINNRGDIALTLDVGGTFGARHAAVYRNGTLQYFQGFGNYSTSLFQINDHGLVIGSADRSSSDFRELVGYKGRLYDANTLVDLPDGWEITSLTGLNNWGQIVGSARYKDEFRPIRLDPLSPIPEPATFLLTLTGLGFVAARTARRHV